VLIVRCKVAGEPGGGEDYHEGGGIGGDLEVEFYRGVDEHGGDCHQAGKTDALCELAAASAQGEDRVPECQDNDAGRQQHAEQTVFGEELEVVVVGVVYQESTTRGAFPIGRIDAVVTPRPCAEQRVILPHAHAVAVEIVARLRNQGGLRDAMCHFFEAHPTADDEDVDHDQAGDQYHHRAWHIPEKDQGEASGDEQAGKKSGIAHA